MDNLESFIRLLRQAGIAHDLDSVSDMVWLAAQMQGHTRFDPAPHPSPTPPAPTDGDDLQGLTSRDPVAPIAPGPATGNLPGVPGSKPTTPQTEGAGKAPVFTEGTRPAEDGAGIAALPFRSPGVAALRGKRELSRALRRCNRRVPSRVRTELDEAATVIALAEQRIAHQSGSQPVYRPASERWLDVVVVADQWASMVIWEQTIREFYALLVQQGAFRNVQLWGFRTVIHGDETKQVSVVLHPDIGFEGARAAGHNPHSLSDPSGRRLFILISDCVSPAWGGGAVGQQLAQVWARHSSVALVQVMPTNFWNRTGLRLLTPLHLRAETAAAPNHTLKTRDPYDTDGLLADAAAATQDHGVPIAVFGLTPRSLQDWANGLIGGNGKWHTGYWLPKQPVEGWQDTLPKMAEASADTDVLPEVLDFLSNATPEARDLAVQLSALPLTLPVMRMVQHAEAERKTQPLNQLNQLNQWHFAEVFLSGLVKRVSPPDLPNSPRHPDDVEYDFLPGVREVLSQRAGRQDTLAVLARLSSFINTHTGEPIDFPALIADPTGTSAIKIGPNNRSFAQVAAQVLRRLGGFHAALADRLEKAIVDAERPAEPVPALQPEMSAALAQRVRELRAFVERQALDTASKKILTNLVQSFTLNLQRRDFINTALTELKALPPAWPYRDWLSLIESLVGVEKFEIVGDNQREFAQIAANIFRELGSEYADLVERIDGALGQTPERPKQTNIAEWSIFVYIAGHNNLDGDGTRIRDQIMSAGGTDNVKLAVLLEGRDGATRQIAGQPEERLFNFHSGDPARLLETIRWAFERCPAKRYGLVLCSHGNRYWDQKELIEIAKQARGEVATMEARERFGTTRSMTLFRTTLQQMMAEPDARERAILFDDGTSRLMDTMELARVCREVQTFIGQPLDVLGLDTGFMSSLEVAYQIRHHVRYLVASEDLVAANSWPYDEILSALAQTPDMGGRRLTQMILEANAQQVARQSNLQVEVSGCVIDLARIGEVAEAVDGLAGALIGEIALHRQILWDAQRYLQNTETRTRRNTGTSKFDFGQWDIGTLAAQLLKLKISDDVFKAAQGVLDAVKPGGTILAEQHLGEWLEGVAGISIYLPPPGVMRRASLYSRLALAQETRWLALIEAYQREDDAAQPDDGLSLEIEIPERAVAGAACEVVVNVRQSDERLARFVGKSSSTSRDEDNYRLAIEAPDCIAEPQQIRIQLNKSSATVCRFRLTPHNAGQIAVVANLFQMDSSGIPASNIAQLRETLSGLDEFQSNASLLTVAMTPELVPLRYTWPDSSTSVYERVNRTIDFLADKRTPSGKPVLIAFLEALSDNYDGDVIKAQLLELIGQLLRLQRDETLLTSTRLQIEVSATPPTSAQTIVNNVSQLREILASLDEFQSNTSLLTVAATSELRPFRSAWPDSSTSVYERVSRTIDFLVHKRTPSGKPLLIVFLEALLDRYDDRDDRYAQLSKLIDQFRLQTEASTTPSAPVQAIVNAEGGINLFAQNSVPTDTLQKLPNGTRLIVDEDLETARRRVQTGNAWLKVIAPDGTAGYVNSRDVRLIDPRLA